MRKLLISMVLLFIPLLLSAQTDNKQYYIYNIVNFNGNIKSKEFTLDIDNGKEITRLKDKDGNKIKFSTPAAALMYLIAEGWELYINGSINNGGVAIGNTIANDSNLYWIIRKPCTKEEFEKEVNAGIIIKNK